MKTRGSVKLVYILLAVGALSLAACGNSQKKKDQAVQKAEQPKDSVTVIETETVVIAVDSIAPDSTAAKKAVVNTPKKTK